MTAVAFDELSTCSLNLRVYVWPTFVVHVWHGEESGEEEGGYHAVGHPLVHWVAPVEVQVQQTEAHIDEQTAHLHQDKDQLKTKKDIIKTADHYC